jgi:dienelactone hydrolase
MSIKTKTVVYQDQGTSLKGYLAMPDGLKGPTPAVLIFHDWTGRNEFACKKAEKLAELGYIGFAVDMYGDAKLGQNNDEKSAFIKPFLEDRKKLRQRLLIALETLKAEDYVATDKIAAIGFCFGGLCALDLARSGANIRGVVSFHGILLAPNDLTNETIKAKVLALHGYDDPMVTPEQVINFAKEMTDAKVDWQMDIYGHTMHAFTNPLANDPSFGTVYNTRADKRSWIAMVEFFKEIL